MCYPACSQELRGSLVNGVVNAEYDERDPDEPDADRPRRERHQEVDAVDDSGSRRLLPGWANGALLGRLRAGPGRPLGGGTRSILVQLARRRDGFSLNPGTQPVTVTLLLEIVKVATGRMRFRDW